MKTPFASRSLSQSARRRMDLAVAVAHERLLGTHVEHALDLIELVGDQVPFDDALAIYHRLLRLSDDEARIITTRALAALGERDDHGARSWPERMAEADAAPEPGQPQRSLLAQLRHRLRGRIHDELRLWIELEAARTEVALIAAHVENALNFVDVLEDETPFTEAVELYLDALDVRESIAEVVYFMTLARLNEKVLPTRITHERQARQTREPAPSPAHPLDDRRLHLVEREGI